MVASLPHILQQHGATYCTAANCCSIGSHQNAFRTTVLSRNGSSKGRPEWSGYLPRGPLLASYSRLGLEAARDGQALPRRRFEGYRRGTTARPGGLVQRRLEDWLPPFQGPFLYYPPPAARRRLWRRFCRVFVAEWRKRERAGCGPRRNPSPDQSRQGDRSEAVLAGSARRSARAVPWQAPGARKFCRASSTSAAAGERPGPRRSVIRARTVAQEIPIDFGRGSASDRRGRL